MTNTDNHSIGRRPFVKGAGASLAALGGIANPAAAKGGPRPLTDRATDILVYSSLADEPTNVEDFGFPFPIEQEAIPGSPMFFVHDEEGGGLFDFGRIKLMPNGHLKNKWLILGGAVMKTGPKPYFLIHREGGLFESVGQEMVFKARSSEEILAALNHTQPPDVPELLELPPALAELAGGKWRAVGKDFARIELDGGEPDPSMPLWGATRIDFYELKSNEFSLSLIYLIVADETPHNPFDGPFGSDDVIMKTIQLIESWPIETEKIGAGTE